jgi:DNA replication and repair protein RecF
VIVQSLSVRHFRSYAHAEVGLAPSVTVVVGDNGAGKTNLLEALYFGAVGRSCRTKVDAQAIQFDQSVARVELEGYEGDEQHSLAVAIDRAEGKTFFADEAKVDSFEPFEWRPPTAVFMPDRLELVKGAPGVRRGHLDQFVAAIWPARRANRQAYAQALAQRNALVSRGGAQSQLDVWDRELARTAAALIADRTEAVELLREEFGELAGELGLADSPSLRYRTVSGIDPSDEQAFVAALQERREADLRRGFTTFGPHRDELVLSQGGRELRAYSSQGQQRTALLALLLTECGVIAEQTGRTPLVLLDDVMSELDATRRQLLVERVAKIGQVMITTTEAEHVPQSTAVEQVLEVTPGKVAART